jgi:hypothetical protein
LVRQSTLDFQLVVLPVAIRFEFFVGDRKVLFEVLDLGRVDWSEEPTAVHGELFVDSFKQEFEVDDVFGFEVVRIERDTKHVEDEVLARCSVRVYCESRGNFLRFYVLHVDLNFVLVFPDERGYVSHVDIVDLGGVLFSTLPDVGRIDRLIRVNIEKVFAESGAK